ncbi:ATP-binding protein [Roseospira navarrensis]|nr:ATP-binding protein [Roseospira navarrensis]
MDLSECEAEPIHLIDRIQPHGCLLVIGGEADRVTHASANVKTVLGRPPDAVLGAPLAESLPPGLLALVQPLIAAVRAARDPETRSAHCPPEQAPDGRACHVTVHRYAGRVIVEIEPDGTPVPRASPDPRTRVTEQAGPGSPDVGALHRIADETARMVADLTGYDRVMMYRFHPDWSGEVIAELRQEGMEPYVGLRYPASDIPSQARALYTLNLLRVIADVAADPVPVLAAGAETDPGAEPLDLSLSVLRSVSNYHIVYLRNMGVRATLVASVMVDGVLWGMIACHHRQPRWVSPSVRQAVIQAAEAFADRVRAHRLYIETRRNQIVDHGVAHLESRLAAGEDPVAVLMTGSERLQDILESDGAVLAMGDALATGGVAPSPAATRRALAAALAADDDGSGVVFVPDLRRVTATGDDPEPRGAPVPSGFAAMILSRAPLIVLGAFRVAEVREVFWAGDPARPAVRTGDTISPRESFAAWKETHEDLARDWEPWVRDALVRCGEVLRRVLDPRNLSPSLPEATDALGSRLEAMAEVSGGLMSIGGESGGLVVRERDGTRRLASITHGFRDLFDVVSTGDDGESLMADHQAAVNSSQLLDRILDRAFGAPVACEFWSRARGRRMIEVVARTLLTLDDPGGTRRWDMISLRDITGAHRSHEAMTIARQRAEAASDLKTEFLAKISHDLKTPLNAIVGFADMIGSGVAGPADDKVREYAGIIGGAGQHLMKLIEDLLDLSRFDSGRNPPRDEVLDLATILRECGAWITVQPKADRLAWSFDVPDPPVWIRGERMALKRAILNLLGNALKFTPPDGAVHLELTRLDDGAVAVSVTDSGLGIPQEELGDIFLPFRRGRSPSIASRDGAGLGLAMVRATVESHGGRVDVLSTPGQGSTFRMVLPAGRVYPAGTHPD